MAQVPDTKLIAAFDALNIIGVTFLSIILLTAAISQRIRRMPTWYLYILSWLLLSAGNLLIMGRQTDELPRRGLCLFQASMTYATPVLCAMSTLVFLVEILLDIKHALQFKIVSMSVVSVLIITPWIFFFVVFFVAFGLGISKPDWLERDSVGMICHLKTNTLSHVTVFFVLSSIQCMLIVGALITATIRQEGIYSHKKCHSFNFILRISLFGLTPIIGVCILLFEFLPRDLGINFAIVDIIYAILPIMAAATFSSQKDIVGVWMFWRRDLDSEERAHQPYFPPPPVSPSPDTPNTSRTHLMA